MNNKFDQLAKGLAQSATRRQALKKFSLGLAGLALAWFGLAERAHAGSASSIFHQCVHLCVKRGGLLSTCESLCSRA
jgi:hypothetical protein